MERVVFPSRSMVTFIRGDERQELRVRKWESLLQGAQKGGIYMASPCGGQGICGKCRVQVISGNVPVSLADRAVFSGEELAEGFRLACAALPRENLEVILPPEEEGNFRGLDSFESEDMSLRPPVVDYFWPEKKALSFARQLDGPSAPFLSVGVLRELSVLADLPESMLYRDRGRVVGLGRESSRLYGIAVDIGTTTIAFALADLETGEIRGRHSVVNRQREFGADVISRIRRAAAGDLALLSGSVKRQIDEGIVELCGAASADWRRVYRAAITGNTAMIHLLLGLNCSTLGRFPFTPVTLDMVSFNYREVFDLDISCEVTILPGISTYVGADITSGILFSNLIQNEGAAAFMDIGTNGEMALFREGKLLCTATAAGPAFEGGNIQWGTGSVPGAISSVRYGGEKFEVETILNKPPIGICGSAVVDTVSEALRHGLILPNGRFTQGSNGYNGEEKIAGLVLAQNPEGKDIIFSQKDVRELQLAKSAICSGLDALIHHSGLDYGEIKTLYLAGGFGFNLNLDSAAAIGLIPPALRPKVRLIGNSALGGVVKFLLNRDHEEELEKIRTLSEEFSLPEDKYFNRIFIENINFDPSNFDPSRIDPSRVDSPGQGGEEG